MREVLSHVPLLGVHSHLSATDSAILWQLRAPRVVLGLLVGGMLALAGGSYQGVFRNPLVDPYLLGVAAGAGLGATIAIAYCRRRDELVRPAADRRVRSAPASASRSPTRSAPRPRAAGNPAALVLAGVTVVAFLTSIQTFIQQQHSQSLQEVYSWILGSLDTAGLARGGARAALRRDLVGRRSCCTGGCSTCWRSATTRRRRSGCNVRRVRLTIVVVRHDRHRRRGRGQRADRLRRDHRPALRSGSRSGRATGSCCRSRSSLGGGFLVLCDVIARTVVSPAELPIGVVTAFFGAPFFAVVLRSSRNFR